MIAQNRADSDLTAVCLLNSPLNVCSPRARVSLMIHFFFVSVSMELYAWSMYPSLKFTRRQLKAFRRKCNHSSSLSINTLPVITPAKSLRDRLLIILWDLFHSNMNRVITESEFHRLFQRCVARGKFFYSTQAPTKSKCKPEVSVKKCKPEVSVKRCKPNPSDEVVIPKVKGRKYRPLAPPRKFK